MFILCDTSSILLLLRIAPNMFVNADFECCIIREIHDELVQTTKFKFKYPWIHDMRSKLKLLMLSEKQKKSERTYFEAIKALNLSGTFIAKTERLFDLSQEDMKVISTALTLEYQISSGDKGLMQFAQQEFPGEFKGSISALEVINTWIEKKLIMWDQEKQNILAEWKTQREVAQPQKAISDFKRLTKSPYPGP
jgi:hypothetical protein